VILGAQASCLWGRRASRLSIRISRDTGQDARCPHSQDGCATKQGTRELPREFLITSNSFNALTHPLTAVSAEDTAWAEASGSVFL
jgi:hypothetical protein